MVVSTNFSAPVEGILLQNPSTKLIVNDKELGTGSLYITEHNVVWGGAISPAGTAVSNITLLYPTISLHAIQREPISALYMILNYELSLPELAQESGGGDTNEEDEEYDADNHTITELRFVPQNEGDLEAMYAAMTQGQTLHPDSMEDGDDDDFYMDGEDFYEGEDRFEDAEESEATPEEAAARLRQLRLDGANGNDDGEDAEIGEE